MRESTPATGEGSTETQTLAFGAVALAVGIWGCSNVVIKTLSTTGLIASFYRLWFAIAGLWVLALSVPSIRRRLDRDWLRACLVGGSLFGLHQILYFNSLKLTSVANVTIIGALQPALVLLVAGRMFHERVTRQALLWSVVALAGTAIVIVGAAGTPGWSPLGDAVAVANLLAFTAYFLVSKEIRSLVGAPEYVVGMTTVAGFVVLAACLVTQQRFGSPVGRDWAIFVFLAIFPGTLGHVLTNWAHRHTTAFVMSIMLLAVPVIASAGAALFLGEALGGWQIGGGTLVLVAIGIIVRSAHGEARTEFAESVAATDAP